MSCLLPYRSYRSCLIWTVACLSLASGVGWAASAADLEVCREQFRVGRYTTCLDASRKAIEDGAYSTGWRILEIESLMALGRYKEAAERADAARRESRSDMRLLRSAHAAYLHSGQAEQAAHTLETVYRIASYRRLEYLSPTEAVALGQCLLELRAEPRVVLENFYNRAVERDPNCREAYLAAGELATSKQDYALAADQYREALKRFGDDPDAHYGLAATFYNSDRQEMIAALDAALYVNPRHAPALILLAEHQIDAEDHEAAARSLNRVFSFNPWRPEAWAYRSVLAHLAGDPNAAEEHRANALKFWPMNPQVDYLIGRKLSQKYRFAEGITYQRRALKADPNYLPAKIQLAQDLLRFGHEQEGWILADEVNARDAYNIEAYNLVNLRDTLSEFTTLAGDGFAVRMDKLEAAIYGDRVLELLHQAKSELCRKYGVKFEHPITVEYFPEQQDFAVRTFGMPGGDGFLGVCFGNVITATSPRVHRNANWEATLWHEFCHAVTLNLTRNKMPRWLSEGISVYEELQRNPTWGQRMNPEYRRMILEGELTPIGDLSTAFMSPASPMHLQFAYYESTLAVEFLIDRFGFESLRAILADLARDEPINDAIARHAAPLDRIERDFAAFARERAEGLAPDVDWEQPQFEQMDAANSDVAGEWLKEHPTSLWALSLYAKNLLAEGRWEEAKAPLEKLIALYPGHVGEDNSYQLLAEAHRNLGETEQEAQVLGRLAALSPDAADAYARLMEIGMEQENWTQVAENGQRYLAVYPLLATVYGRLGRASEELGRDEPAVESYRRLLLLDPPDPVDVHYRLARLLHRQDPAAAKRHILEALADAPRFRDGHRLLLTILEETSTHAAPAANTEDDALAVEEERK